MVGTNVVGFGMLTSTVEECREVVEVKLCRELIGNDSGCPLALLQTGKQNQDYGQLCVPLPTTGYLGETEKENVL